MSTIEERTARREAELAAALEETRRQAYVEDYVWDKAQCRFWDLRDGTLHEDKAVDASIPLERWRVVVQDGDEDDAPGEASARRGRPRRRREQLVQPSKDIMRIETDQTVEGSTWWPGREQVIKDWFIDRDGFYPSKGRRIYNQYKRPPELNGDPALAGVWLDHVKRLWPDRKEHEYFFDYCAHMVQFPEVKCNAAIVLSGTQGIGKDAALLPVKEAVGSWNTKGIDPDELFSQYKPWIQTLMLVVDEVRPSKDEFHASSMYNILKPMIVAPPNTLPLNDKYAKLRYIINVMRVFITTNDWMAMYIPAEDRRMFIMHSTLIQNWHIAEGKPNYFIDLFAWFASGGDGHVSAWLKQRDLSEFNPKAQVEKTAGWEAVANTWSEPEDAVSQALDILERPPVVFGSEMVRIQFDGAEDILGMLKSPRKIGHRMQRAGYIAVQNPGGGKWSFKGEETSITAKLAFVKMDSGINKNDMVSAIIQRGESLVKK
jgi:hypothetical protein